MKKLFAALLSLFGLVMTAQAQVTGPPQFSQPLPQHLDAATLVVAGTAAVATALTLTIPAVAGQFAYITSIALNICNDGTGGAPTPNTAVTSTNLGGWLTEVGASTTANVCVPSPPVFQFFNGFKSAAAGTATTVVVANPGTHTAASGFITYYNSN